MITSHARNPKAILLGAFSRFNYGDLLFPLIVGNEFDQFSPATKREVYALFESDMSRFGAAKTKPVRSLHRAGSLDTGDVVVFAGGGTIGVDWTYMYSNLLGKRGNTALYYLKRFLGEQAADTLCRIRLGVHRPYPWIAAPEDFPVPVKIAYNAVGGSEFGKLPVLTQDRILRHLDKASYLSVRDAETQRLLSRLEDVSIELAPDSAILMSEQYPVERLETLVSSSILDTLNGNPYVCFQTHISYARAHTDNIVTALEEIREAYGLRAVLLPIGRYVGLEDQVALEGIQKRMRSPCNVISDEASLFDIMLTIARAKVFVGTSLHGNITSQSFCVPHLGLSDTPCKVDYYLGTWDLPEQSRCVPLKEIPDQVGKIIRIPDATMKNKRQELISRSHSNFAKLAKACDLEWSDESTDIVKTTSAPDDKRMA
jgi:exopolysaccharide biosynthesis predicted pyruvyltransferase EpsI